MTFLITKLLLEMKKLKLLLFIPLIFAFDTLTQGNIRTKRRGYANGLVIISGTHLTLV